MDNEEERVWRRLAIAFIDGLIFGFMYLELYGIFYVLGIIQ